MPQTLVVKCAGAAQATIYRSANGTLTQIGNPFTPSTSMLTDNAALSKAGLVAQFGDALYGIVGGDIRKFDPATQNWVAEVVPGYTLVDAHQHTGFFVGRSVAGVPRLIVLFLLTGPVYRALYLEPGGAWTLGAVGPAGSVGTAGPLAKAVKFRSTVQIGNARDLVTYDVQSDAWTVTNLGGAGATHLDVCFTRAQGRLFALRTSTGGADEYLNVYERVAGSWVLVVNGSTSIPTLPRADASGRPANTSGWAAMHYDDASSSLIVHAYEDRGGGARGWKCLQIALAGYTVTDRTVRVPIALRYPAGPDISPSSYSAHIQVQVENEHTPLTPVTRIWLEVNDGPWSSYTWNGVGADITDFGGSVEDRTLAIPHAQLGGGEYVYEGSYTTNPETSVEELNARIPLLGGTRVFFRGYTFDDDATGAAPAAQVKTVGIYYTVNGQAPNLLGSLTAVGKLSGPGAVPTLVSNKAVGCTFDGTSIYYADWSAQTTDGLVDGQLHLLMPRAE